MKFGCQIKNGKLVFNRAKDFADYCKTLVGKELMLTLTDKKAKRSDNQNAYYWSVIVKDLSEELGYETDEIHLLLKEMFIPKKYMTVKGLEFAVIPSTTKLSTKEFKEYIEKIQRWASGQGIYLPDPNEYLI
ncbi:MAG: hypothetical protein BWY21_01994 [Parcubacteria group bacterium ADurb.Bin216]|nr:MAG: hypothetical protein BWY21_01994 [Parcubacteria group bacterium ADurb.Bin216]